MDKALRGHIILGNASMLLGKGNSCVPQLNSHWITLSPFLLHMQITLCSNNTLINFYYFHTLHPLSFLPHDDHWEEKVSTHQRVGASNIKNSDGIDEKPMNVNSCCTCSVSKNGGYRIFHNVNNIFPISFTLENCYDLIKNITFIRTLIDVI